MPLNVSARLAPIVAFGDLILAFILLLEKSSFLRYIEEKQEQLFLSDQDLEFVQNHMRVIYCILFAMAAVEGLRFYILKRLKENLDELDEENRSVSLRNHARNAAVAQRLWETNPHNDNGGSTITSPLLSENNQGGQSTISSVGSSYRQQDLNDSTAAWWEEPPDPNVSSALDSNTSDNSGGGFLSKLFKTPSKNPSAGEDGAPVSSGVAFFKTPSKIKSAGEDGASESSGVAFEPVDEEEIVTGITPWDSGSDGDGGGDGGQSNTSWADEEYAL